MTADEEAAYVREVASQKTAALRMSLDAVERQGMPFVGETGGVGSDAPTARPVDRAPDQAGLPRRPGPRTIGWPPPAARPTPIATTTSPRAPRPDKMQR